LGVVDRGFRTIVVTDAICGESGDGDDAIMHIYNQRFTEQVETAEAETVLSQWCRS
jgi:nicotinamidase-related amidase